MKPKNAFLLFLAAFIWGIAFVAQSSAAEIINPFTFNGIRCLIGGITLLPFLFYNRQKNTKSLPLQEGSVGRGFFSLKDLSHALPGGLACGICLCLGSTLQQFGISQTSVGKAGFITALYIVFVPVVSTFVFGKKIAFPVIVSVILSVTGLFFLCVTEGFSVGKGDFLVLLCSFAFTAHILVIDHFNKKIEGVVLSCLQFFVCAIISLPFILFWEKPEPAQIMAAAVPILYAGVMSCGIAYTLQIVGQKNMNPTIASLILSLESVVSALAGWVLLNQTLSPKELTGCVLMFIAIFVANISDLLTKKK